MDILKFSNAGGFTTKTRYADMLAGNAVWNPYTVVGSYDSIATVTLGSANSVTFSSIPQTYTHLQFRCWAPTINNWIQIGVNGLTGANYTYHELRGDGSGASSSAGFNDAGLLALAQGSGSASYGTAFITDILDYTNTNKNKTVRTFYGVDQNGSGTVGLTSNLYKYTSAISSVTFYANYYSAALPSGTTIALYGVK